MTPVPGGTPGMLAGAVVSPSDRRARAARKRPATGPDSTNPGSSRTHAASSSTVVVEIHDRNEGSCRRDRPVAVRRVRARRGRRHRHAGTARGARGRPGRVAPVARCELREAEEHLEERAVAPRRRARPGRRRPGVRARSARGRRRPAHAGARRRTRPTAAATAARRSHAHHEAARAASSPASRSCRCRGSRGASWRGPAGRGAPVGSAARGGDDARRGRRARVGLGPPRAGPVPGRRNADASAIPVGEVLGWLVAAGADQAGDDVAPSVRWLGRRRDLGRRARRARRDGAAAPPTQAAQRSAKESSGSYSVRWTPALVDSDPARTVGVEHAGQHRARSTGRSTPVRSPVRRSPAWSTRSAATARAGSRFRRRRRASAPPTTSPRHSSPGSTAARSTRRSGSGARSSTKVERWGALGHRAARAAHRAARSARRRRRVAALAVLAAGPRRRRRSRSSRRSSTAAPTGTTSRTRWRGSSACSPCCCARAALRRGQVILSDDEAWDLMTTTGPGLLAAGFDVRVPALSRRKPRRPSLRVFADTVSDSVVGANQLADVRWSALFDDVELTAADIAKLAKEARPLIRCGGRWVAIDQADLEGRGRGARRARRRRPSCPAARCCGSRSASRARRSPAASPSRAAVGRPICSTAAANLSRPRRLPRRAGSSASCAATRPRRSPGSASSTRWVSAAASRSTWASARRRRCSRTCSPSTGDGPALVIAPPAVVGNWTAEAAALHAQAPRGRAPRREPRRRADELATEVAGADVVITTYGTAVRDVDAIADVAVGRRGPRRGAGDQEPRQRDVATAAPIEARTRVALTGTPIENGLGDLWAILDFTNPGLVGPRPQFIAAALPTPAPRRASTPKTRCARSTASSCSAARRPSPRSRPSCPTRSTSSTTAR